MYTYIPFAFFVISELRLRKTSIAVPKLYSDGLTIVRTRFAFVYLVLL